MEQRGAVRGDRPAALRGEHRERVAWGRRKVSNKSPSGTALTRAVAYLARRAVSAAKLRVHLLDKGFSVDDVGEAIERLTAEGYLNDGDLARARARDLATRRGYWGPALSQRLADQGFEESERTAACAEIEERHDPRDLALRSLERRYGESWHETPERRLGSFLERRGYPLALIVSLVRQARDRDRD